MYHPHYQQHPQHVHQQQHVGLATPGVTSPPSPSSSSSSTNALKQQQQLLQHQQFAKEFWEDQLATVEETEPDFKNHPLPLARIKKVMKSDPEVKVRRERENRESTLGVHVGLEYWPLSSGGPQSNPMSLLAPLVIPINS